MLFKLSNLNSNLALTLSYLNPALNNSAQGFCRVSRFIALYVQCYQLIFADQKNSYHLRKNVDCCILCSLPLFCLVLEYPFRYVISTKFISV